MYWLFNNIYFNKIYNFNNNLKKQSNILNLKNINFLYNYDYSFGNINFIAKKFLILYFKENNKYYYGFNGFNHLFFLNFFKFINLFLKNYNNFLIIDKSYDYILPFYNYKYGARFTNENKGFFFVTKKNIILKNWLYFYKSNLKKNNISFLVVLDYNSLKPFFLNFLKFNLPIFSILDNSSSSQYVDYFFYCSLSYINILKLIIFNKIISMYFYYYNLKLNIFKKIFNLKLIGLNKIK